jgi:DNA-binding Xre family transcriptional regulator
MVEVSMKLADLMIEKNYSYRDLSEEAGIALSALVYIVNGKTKNPHPKKMREIARILDVEVQEIDEFAAAMELRRSKETRQPEVNLLAGVIPG